MRTFHSNLTYVLYISYSPRVFITCRKMGFYVSLWLDWTMCLVVANELKEVPWNAFGLNI